MQLQPLVDALTAELLCQPVLHADEPPVAMLKFDFADSRGGQHARDFLGLPGTPGKPAWQGKLVCDDFAG